MLNGIDFSFGSGLTTAQIKAGGKTFVCRYLSGGNSKDITGAELANYKAADIPVIFVWETTGTDMTSVAAGRSDATVANTQVGQVGAPGAVVFFAADEAQEPDLRGYFDGVLEVLPKTRVGIYGGLGSVKAAFDAGLVSYGWQTLAWSNGQWDDRALIRQVQNNVRFGPATVDLDEAAYWNSSKVLGVTDDFGQWPRPTQQPSKGPYRHEIGKGNTYSFTRWATDVRHESRDMLLAYNKSVTPKLLSQAHYDLLAALAAADVAAEAAKVPRCSMEPGTVLYTENP